MDERAGNGEDQATHPSQQENLRNRLREDESPLTIGSHAAYFAFIRLLIVLIQVKNPSSPTAFQTHPASMIIFLISLCLYAGTIMLRILVKTRYDHCSQIFNHSFFFLGIVPPVSLVSVFLPYNCFWLLFFIYALFSTTLAHLFLQMKAAIISRLTRRLSNFVDNLVATYPLLFTGSSGQ